MSATLQRASCAALLALALGACGSAATDPDRDDPRLIELDGITITFEELQPYYDWLTEFRPGIGVRTKYMWAMR